MRPALRILSCYLTALALLWPSSTSATTIDPLLFEELVLGADFVGIVECEQAGGIVAAYQVIESWKGPKPGTRITIRMAINPDHLSDQTAFVPGAGSPAGHPHQSKFAFP